MATEPSPNIDPPLQPEQHLDRFSHGSKLYRRRKSSNLRGDPRGDTGAPALTTMYDQSPVQNEVISFAYLMSSRDYHVIVRHAN